MSSFESLYVWLEKRSRIVGNAGELDISTLRPDFLLEVSTPLFSQRYFRQQQQNLGSSVHSRLKIITVIEKLPLVHGRTYLCLEHNLEAALDDNPVRHRALTPGLLVDLESNAQILIEQALKKRVELTDRMLTDSVDKL